MRVVVVLRSFCGGIPTYSTNIRDIFCFAHDPLHPLFIPSIHPLADVVYDVADFPDKNKDTLNQDVVAVLVTSDSPLMNVLFPAEEAEAAAAAASGGGGANRKRPTTSGFKIKQQVRIYSTYFSHCFQCFFAKNFLCFVSLSHSPT